MSNETVNQMQSQIEKTAARPARTYASLVLDHFEQLTSLQLETAKACAETSIQQARAALEVKDSADLQGYVEYQQKVAKDLSERVKGDIEKATSLNQAFVQNAQKLTQDKCPRDVQVRRGRHEQGDSGCGESHQEGGSGRGKESISNAPPLYRREAAIPSSSGGRL